MIPSSTKFAPLHGAPSPGSQESEPLADPRSTAAGPNSRDTGLFSPTLNLTIHDGELSGGIDILVNNGGTTDEEMSGADGI